MPFNVTQGDTVSITVTFFASSAPSVVTVPSSATLTITYPMSSASLVTASASVAMAQTGNFFTANWASSVAALGLTTLSAAAPGQATPTTETLRVTT